MEIDDQEDGATRRRSGRIRGRKPTEGDSPPSLVSATGVLPVSPRGSRGRGRGRGRPAKTKSYEEPEDDNSDGDGAGSDIENNMSTSQSDSENSDSNPTNGFELSNNASMEVEDSADNYGYSAYTTADLTDTSAIDGQDYGIVSAEAEVGPEINFEGQKEFEAENSEPSNEIVFGQQNSVEEREVIDQNQTSNSNATYGEEPSVSPEAVEREKDEEQPAGGSQDAEIENTEAEGEKEGDGGSKRKLDELENSTEASQEENSNSVSEGPTPAKKALLEINVRKLLPDLEKHWKPVEEDPNDFTAWTYLLQYVDQENELLAAREAYDGFLSRYPYCYGYWKKYADYEKRKGSAEDCEQVFRRGLKAISLSVDLWIHYLNYVKAAHENDQAYIRAQFDAAIDACGTEFRSDKLWDHYLQWEKEANNLQNVLSIYDQVIAMPTQSYQAHFQHMKDFIHLHPPADILAEEEYLELKASIEPAGEEENATEPDETTKIREKIVEKRTIVHKNTEAEITARWSFEEAIKRPYFHVKPLEKGQLKMWKEYLDFEIEKGIQKRIIVLFERCLIACALYEEYWIKYIKFLQTQKELDVEKLRSVFVRACTIHHQNKPWINMHWAAFEEEQGSFDKASEILQKLYKMLPESIYVYYRHINLERRRGDFEKCGELFEKYISECKNKANAAHLTIKYARFVAKNVGDNDKAMKILQEAINLDDSTRAKVVMALVNLGMEQRPVDTKLVLSTFEQVLKSEISNEQKITFAHRKVEFLEDYGEDVESVEKAQEELQSLAKLLRERKSPDDGSKPPSSEENKGSTSNGSTYNQYGQQQPPYGQQYNQYGQYSNWNYQQPSSYGYNNQPGWSAYQGYYGGAEATTDA